MSGTPTPASRKRPSLAPAPVAAPVTEPIADGTKGTAESNGVTEQTLVNVVLRDINGITEADIKEMQTFRERLDSFERSMRELIRDNWKLPFSKETMFAFGLLIGEMGKVGSMVGHDTKDIEMTLLSEDEPSHEPEA